MSKWLFLSGVLFSTSACGQLATEESTYDTSPPAATGSGPSAPAAGSGAGVVPVCAFSEGASRAVLAATVGPYGGKQEVYVVRADGSLVLARTFGAARTESQGYTYIEDAKIERRGAYLLASRGTDGASVLDLAGTSLLDAATIDEAKAFLLSRGVDVEKEAPQISVESPAGTPMAVIRRGTARTEVPLPDYRGEPNVEVESVRGDWALLSSYTADRSWRVDLKTAAITPMSKATPAGLQQFGAYQVAGPRLYFTLDDDGGFLATLRDPYAGAVYHSPDGVTAWTRIGSAARDVKNVVAGAQNGTYVVAGITAGPDTAPWSAAPADYGPVVSGDFVEVVRPSTGKRYAVPHAAVTVSRDGRCAAYVDVAKDGARRTTILDVESGALTVPQLPIDATSAGPDVTLRWIPQS